MTPIEAAREIAVEHGYTDTSDDHLDWLLWERTAFPICSLDHTAAQLDRYMANSRRGEAENQDAVDAMERSWSARDE